MSHMSPFRKKLLAIVKVTVAAVILVFLFQRIQGESGFERLLNEPKDWISLAMAQVCVLVAFSLSFVRWYLLVRGLDLDFHLTDAFRLGTLGFMLNQVSPGSLGGDLIKAVFIAKEQPQKKTEAVATVLIDRVVGLYAMLILASLGIALAGGNLESKKLLTSLQTIVWASTLGCTVVFGFVLSSWATGKKARAFAESIPGIGPTMHRLVEAADVYRSRRGYLLASFGLAMTTHCLLISAFWCISRGVPVSGPTFAQNASIVPIALVAGALPLTPGGLGALEGGMEFLYTLIGAAKGDGTIVALAYRAMTYIFAAVGAFYYFSSRKKVDDMLHDAEVLAEEAA